MADYPELERLRTKAWAALYDPAGQRWRHGPCSLEYRAEQIRMILIQRADRSRQSETRGKPKECRPSWWPSTPDPPMARRRPPGSIKAERRPGHRVGPVTRADQDDLHARMVEWFEDGERVTHDGRALSLRDRDYDLRISVVQRSRRRKALAQARGQPDVTINYWPAAAKSGTDVRAGAQVAHPIPRHSRAIRPTTTRPTRPCCRRCATSPDDNNFPIIRSDVYENTCW